jgi:hypothetical protein
VCFAFVESVLIRGLLFVDSIVLHVSGWF